MYHRIIILALLFLLSEKTSTPIFSSPMEISDGLPVQFWLTGCATYNEHQAPGVHHKCFCAPWECDDTIKVQFTDDPSQNYTLEIYDSTDALLGTRDFDEVSVGVYEANLNIADDSPDVCDQQINLKIRREAGVQGVTLPAFSLWASDGGAGNAWTTGSNPSVIATGGGSNTEFLFVDYAFIPGVEYTVSFNYDVSGVTIGARISVIICDSSFTSYFNNGIDVMSALNGDTNTITFTATTDTTRIAIRIIPDSFTGVTVDLNTSTATRSIGSSEVVAQTDCLDIRQNHEDTILLTYSNHRNFAGLVYENVSPETEFTIRIPAIFFHQRFPEEDELMELSTSLATLNGVVRKQRLLDTDYLPYYFHEKLKLILKHQTLSIFSREWVKQEAYEIAEGDRRWPVKKAKCWLSEKDFVHRNIL
jgi:hypothetical protein